MKAILLITIGFFLQACNPSDSTETATGSLAAPAVTECDASALSLKHDADDRRNFIVLTKPDTLSFELPGSGAVSGFSLDEAKPTEDGFLLSCEYGSRNYFRTTFYFSCVDGKYFLTSKAERTFDKQNPARTAEKDSSSVARVALEQFKLLDYL